MHLYRKNGVHTKFVHTQLKDILPYKHTIVKVKMDTEQQQQGAMEYAVVDTSKKKQKRDEQQNVSTVRVLNFVVYKFS